MRWPWRKPERFIVCDLFPDWDGWACARISMEGEPGWVEVGPNHWHAYHDLSTPIEGTRHARP